MPDNFTISISLLSEPISTWSAYVTDLEKLSSKLKQNLKLNYDPIQIHLDVIDQSYNLDAKPQDFEFYENIAKSTRLKCDLHLMMKSLDQFVRNPKPFRAIFYHPRDILENRALTNQFSNNLNENSDMNWAINPDEHISMMTDKRILLMTVFPGKSGQKFIPPNDLNQKIVVQNNLQKIITFDGGITRTTLQKVKHLGQNFVIGSDFFKQDNKIQYLTEIMEILRS